MVNSVERAPLVTRRSANADPVGRAFGRVCDVVAAALLLLMLAPLMALIAVLIRRDGGPALVPCRQACGPGRADGMMVFRTTGAGTGRITRLGDWLCRTGLDRLPALFAVLRGSASLIGGLFQHR